MTGFEQHGKQIHRTCCPQKSGASRRCPGDGSWREAVEVCVAGERYGHAVVETNVPRIWALGVDLVGLCNVGVCSSEGETENCRRVMSFEHPLQI